MQKALSTGMTSKTVHPNNQNPRIHVIPLPPLSPIFRKNLFLLSYAATATAAAAATTTTTTTTTVHHLAVYTAVKRGCNNLAVTFILKKGDYRFPQL
jgi:hypothetical protein